MSNEPPILTNCPSCYGRPRSQCPDCGSDPPILSQVPCPDCGGLMWNIQPRCHRVGCPSFDPPTQSRCEHGISEGADCEQCIWEQSVADDQATDEDYDDDE